MYSKTCVKRPLSNRPKIGFHGQLSLNAGQKYCRMLQREHSAILSTFIKLPFVIKIFVLSIFEWPFFHRFYCIVFTRPRSAVGNRCESDCRSRGSKFDPGPAHTFVEIDHEIISMVILLPLAESFKKGCCQIQAKVCS